MSKLLCISWALTFLSYFVHGANGSDLHGAHDHVEERMNPILPGFHPDPSCIYVPNGRYKETFLCASSSFNVFPGIPIHASQDLVRWRLIGNVLSRPTQLPQLTQSTGGTSGIWAPTLRYHEATETFYLFTTLVFDRMPKEDNNRFQNIFFKTKNPFSSWSDPTHFKFTGYDVSPWWDVEGVLEDGKIYVQGAHTWEIGRHVDQIILDLETGEATPQTIIWEGTGGIAPEAPHIYLRNGWYYLMIAEGGTGMGHMVTMARSRDITGPYEPCPHNPVLTNSGTDELFQGIGHGDLFEDPKGNLWAVALSTRGGPEFVHFPMGRETVLTNVSWPLDQDWPVFQPVTKTIGGEPLERKDNVRWGPLVDSNDHITSFPHAFKFPPHFLHWRLPTSTSYIPSPPEYRNSLKVLPSKLNLTGYDGQGVEGKEGEGWLDQTFVGRRQAHTLFKYTVEFDVMGETKDTDEVGVTVFLTQNHHIDFSFLPSQNALRLRSITYIPGRTETLVPLQAPAERGARVKMQIQGVNVTHYEFAYSHRSLRAVGRDDDTEMEIERGRKMTTVGYASTEDISWGFDGALLGVFATTNGLPVPDPASADGIKVYLRRWEYLGMGQIRE